MRIFLFDCPNIYSFLWLIKLNTNLSKNILFYLLLFQSILSYNPRYFFISAYVGHLLLLNFLLFTIKFTDVQFFHITASGCLVFYLFSQYGFNGVHSPLITHYTRVFSMKVEFSADHTITIYPFPSKDLLSIK